MGTKSRSIAALEPYLLSILRIILGFTFSLHGAQKLLGAFGGKQPPAFTLSWTAGVLELVGGALIIAGLFTRPVAFILSGQMAFAYFLVHAGRGFWPIANGGELAVVYCFAFLYLSAAGAGPLSLDRGLRKTR